MFTSNIQAGLEKNMCKLLTKKQAERVIEFPMYHIFPTDPPASWLVLAPLREVSTTLFLSGNQDLFRQVQKRRHV